MHFMIPTVEILECFLWTIFLQSTPSQTAYMILNLLGLICTQGNFPFPEIFSHMHISPHMLKKEGGINMIAKEYRGLNYITWVHNSVLHLRCIRLGYTLCVCLKILIALDASKSSINGKCYNYQLFLLKQIFFI